MRRIPFASAFLTILCGSQARSVLTILALAGSVSSAKAQAITRFTVPRIAVAIAAGPDGNLWFTEGFGGSVGRMTTDGVVTEFAIPTAGVTASAITAGPGGNLWFTEYRSADETGPGVAMIARITAAGEITEFPISTSYAPFTIVTGSDGGLWFGSAEGRIVRFGVAGVMREFSTGGGLACLARGPDGNLWFARNSTISSWIGRITTSGVVTTFQIPGFPSGRVSSLTTGPDGNLWFTEKAANRIGRITTSGVITEFEIPRLDSGPSDIVAGPDGNLWFTEERGGRIGRITRDGDISEFGLRAIHETLSPAAIAAGSDDNLWFTESSANRISRITTAGTCAADAHSLCLSGGRFLATATYRNRYGSGPAVGTMLSDSSGLFTFDNPDSIELVVKVLNACSFGQGFWAFAAGLTDQEVTLTVTDTVTNEFRTYTNPLGTAFVTVTDTAAFSTCP
jgi:streptogramin lyase